jgi:hypothetical protein
MNISNYKILATNKRELYVLTPAQQKSVETFADDIRAGNFGKADPNNFNPGED